MEVRPGRADWMGAARAWFRSSGAAAGRALLLACALAALLAGPARAAGTFIDGDDADTAAIPVPAAGKGLLVVALGDSVASGEGNPDHGHWRSRQCHRS